MQSNCNKIVAFIMAIVVLCSTMSFAVELHYCGDDLVDAAIFSEAKKCTMHGDDMMDHDMSMHHDMDVIDHCQMEQQMMMSCCEDQHILIEGQDELKITFEDLTVDQQYAIATLLHSYIDLFEGLESYFIPFQEYPPPVLIKDINTLYETYLI